MNVVVEPDESNDTGPCECCGSMSRTAGGYLSVDGVARRLHVSWTLGQVKKHGANVDLSMGEWGEGAAARGVGARGAGGRRAVNDR